MSSRACRSVPRPVVEHRAVDDVGEASFEAAHGFVGGFAARLLAVVVGAAFGGVAELDDGHDVQDPVDLPVPASGEPVADVVAGGGVDGGGAGPGREVAAVGEPGDVADLDQQPGAPEGPMPCRSIRPVPVRRPAR